MLDGPYLETWKDPLTSSGIDVRAKRDEQLGLGAFLWVRVARE